MVANIIVGNTVVPEHPPRAAVGINRRVVIAVLKNVVLDINRFLGPPIQTVCPRAVAVVFLVPIIVVHLDSFVPVEVEETVVDDSVQMPVGIYSKASGIIKL